MYEVDTHGVTAKVPDLKILADWADALDSGEYRQGTGTLRSDEGFCCLGVLSELAVKAGVIPPAEEVMQEDYETGDVEPSGVYAYNGKEAFPPSEVISWVWGDDEEAADCGDPFLIDEDGDRERASMLNDAHDYSFAQIAAAIRRTFKL